MDKSDDAWQNEAVSSNFRSRPNAHNSVQPTANGTNRYYEVEGPRPPVPGKEDIRRAPSNLRLDPGCGGRFACPALASSNDGGTYRGNSGTDASFTLQQPPPHPPAQRRSEPDNALHWARSLEELLRDEEGVQLLSRYLESEHLSNKPLMFWFACQGLKRTAFSPDDRDLLHRRVKAIYRTFLRTANHSGTTGAPLPVSPECRRAVRDRINNCPGSADQLDPAIFDECQAQVEAHMSRTVYSAFLRSDLYLERLRGTTSFSGGGAGSAPRSLPLPTLHEDAELETIGPQTVAAHARRVTSGPANSVSSVGRDALLRDAAYFYQPSLPYHVTSGPSGCRNDPYSTNVVPSALDSELQSMSSEAFSEDVASGSEVSGGHSSISARQQSDKKFHLLLLNNNNKSHNYGNPSAAAAAARKSLRHHTNKILKEHTQHNAISASYSSGCDPLTFIPKMPQPTNTMPPSDPKMFVSVLTEKLNAVLREREKEEKLGDSIRRLHVQEGDLEGSDLHGCGGPKTGKAAAAANLAGSMLYPGSMVDENSQSILDEHVSRVWKDSPPLQLPPTLGDPNQPNRSKHHNVRASPYRCRSPPEPTSINPLATRHHLLRSSVGPAACPTLNVTMATDHVHSTLEAAAASLIASSTAAAASLPAEQALAQPGCPSSTYHPLAPPPGTNASANTHYYPQQQPAALDGKNNEKIYNWLSHTQKYAGTPLAPTLTGHKDKATGSTNVPSQQVPCSPNLTSAPRDAKHYTTYKTPLGGTQTQFQNVGHVLSGQPQSQGMARPPPFNHHHLKRSSSTSSGVSSLLSCPPPPGSFTAFSLKPAPTGRGGYDTLSSAFVSEVEEDSLPTSEPVPVPVSLKESTVVGYYFCNEPVPYRTKLPGKDITLGQFKALLRKKGNYRYYFKTVSDEFQTGVINEEISEDEQVLPLWEGKIFAKVELVEQDT